MNLISHPALVHFPIGISVLMPILIGFLLLKHSKAWSILLPVCVVLIAATHLTLYTGEEAEDEHKNPDPLRKEMIHEHEELAETVVPLVWITGILVAGGLWLPEKFRNWSRMAAMVVAIILSAQVLRTGKAGGALVHGEGARAAVEEHHH